MGFLVTTTGTQGSGQPTFPADGKIVLRSLGARTLEHPTTNLDLSEEFTEAELFRSPEIWAAQNYGWVVIQNAAGLELDVGQSGPGLGAHPDVDLTTTPPQGSAADGVSGSAVGDILSYDQGMWTPTKFAYRHIQGTAAATWVVNHNLARRVSAVYIENSFGEECMADIAQLSNNQLEIRFSAAESGRAYLL